MCRGLPRGRGVRVSQRCISSCGAGAGGPVPAPRAAHCVLMRPARAAVRWGVLSRWAGAAAPQRLPRSGHRPIPHAGRVFAPSNATFLSFGLLIWYFFNN